MKSANGVLTVRIGYGLVVCAVLIAGTLVVNTAQRFSDARSDWEDSGSEAEAKGLYLAQIRAAFGYGGLIHKFKNLVLRQDLDLADPITEDVEALKSAIAGFRILSDNPDEHEALRLISEVLEKYGSNVAVVTRLASEGRTSREIDRIVRIDDQPALAAFRLLESNWLSAGVRAGESSAVVLSEAETEIDFALGAIIVALVAGLVLFVLARRDARTKERLSAVARTSEKRLSEAHRIAKLGHWEFDAASQRFTAYGEMIASLNYGGTKSKFTYEDALRPIHPEDVRSVHAAFQRSFTEGVPYDQSNRVVYDDGRIGHMQLIGEVVCDDAGAFVGMRGTTQDITEQKEAEEATRRSEASLENAQRIAHLGSWDMDVETREGIWSDELFRIFGMGPQEEAPSYEGFMEFVHPNDKDRLIAALEATLFEEKPYRIDYRVVLKNGDIRALRGVGEVFWDGHRGPVTISGTIQDITEQKEAEEALRDSERRLAWAQDKARLGSWERNLATGASIWSDQLNHILDLDPDTPTDLGQLIYHYIHPDDVENVRQAVGLLVDTGKPLNAEYRIRSAQGHEKTVRGYGELICDEANNPIAIGGTVQDVTALRQAEQKLQQAQKMEAVGQLTGGIAHDFNNLLAVVMGNLELAQDELPANSNLKKMLEAAFGASQRGADLTGRLLSFSRRQTLTPKATDINELAEDMLGLARRTLGEAVEVVFESTEEAWWAHVDPAQLENALLNLAINARDAMPDGGTLTIRTGNVSTRGKTLSASDVLPAGEYVLIEVEDTGVGMSEDVREKVFEPFFTTKEAGEGSGLGLSMVYGFANQSEGHVDIESTEGEGTRICLYLPRSEPLGQEVPEVTTTPLKAREYEETVLVVEDDLHVRKLVVSLVESLGYTVLKAGDASSALEIMASGTQVDLLLSDVILGKGMNGVELANQIQENNPETKVLLMSGYAREAFTEEDGLGDTYELIAKPFRKADLTQHIEVLLQ